MAFAQRFVNAYRALKASGVGPARSAISALFLGGKSSFAFGNQENITFIEAVNKGYKGLVWVYRCVKEIGEGVGSVHWVVAEEKDNGTLVEVRDRRHALRKLLEKPNPWQDSSEFFEAWAIYLSLSGNDYWNIINVQDKPYQLYHVRPDWMAPVPDPVAFISGYQLDNKAGFKQTYPVEEILHFKYLDPMDPYKGMSPLTAAQRTMETEHSAILWNKTIFDNAAVPGGVLTIPATTLQTETREKLQDDLQSQFSRENMNKPLVLWGGMDWKQMSMSMKDLDFGNLKLMNKFEICAALGVPPGIVGANEDPTYSNYGVERLGFWEDTIIPMVMWLAKKMNQRLAPAFGDNIVIVPDFSHVPAMREAMNQKVGQAKTLTQMGWPLNAVNQKLKLGFDPVPWGDVWWAPMNMAPISSPDSPLLADGGSPPLPPGHPADDEGAIEDPDADPNAITDPEDRDGKGKKPKPRKPRRPNPAHDY